MNNTNDQGLFQEIEEDLARKRAEAIWRKYGGTVLAIAVTIVIATAVASWWQNWRVEKAQAQTDAYVEISQKKTDKAITSMAIVSELEDYAKKFDGAPMAVMAQLEAAALAAGQNKTDKAIEIYKQMAADEKMETAYRQLAELLSVNLSIDTGDVTALRARLEPLTKEGVWKMTAMELSAHLAIKAGDKAKAKELFLAIKALPNVTRDADIRATDMLSWLNKGE